MLNSVNKIFEGTKQSRIGKVAVADYVICGAYSWHFRVPSKNENKKKTFGKMCFINWNTVFEQNFKLIQCVNSFHQNV